MKFTTFMGAWNRLPRGRFTKFDTVWYGMSFNRFLEPVCEALKQIFNECRRDYEIWLYSQRDTRIVDLSMSSSSATALIEIT
jgi:hypothetical protein